MFNSPNNFNVKHTKFDEKYLEHVHESCIAAGTEPSYLEKSLLSDHRNLAAERIENGFTNGQVTNLMFLKMKIESRGNGATFAEQNQLDSYLKFEQAVKKRKEEEEMKKYRRAVPDSKKSKKRKKKKKRKRELRERSMSPKKKKARNSPSKPMFPSPSQPTSSIAASRNELKPRAMCINTVDSPLVAAAPRSDLKPQAMCINTVDSPFPISSRQVAKSPVAQPRPSQGKIVVTYLTKEELSDWEHDWNCYQDEVMPDGCNDWADVPDLDNDIIYPSDDITEPSYSSLPTSAGSPTKPPSNPYIKKDRGSTELVGGTKGGDKQLTMKECRPFHPKPDPSSTVTLSEFGTSSFDDELSNFDIDKNDAANTLRLLASNRANASSNDQSVARAQHHRHVNMPIRGNNGSKVVVETQRRGQPHSFKVPKKNKPVIDLCDDSSIDSGDDDTSSQGTTTTEDSYDSDDDFIKNSSESDTEVSDDSSDEESLSDESSSSDSSDSN